MHGVSCNFLPNPYFRAFEHGKNKVLKKTTAKIARCIMQLVYVCTSNIRNLWNVFVKPKDPRELAHLGLARTFVQVRAEAKLAWIMPSAAESLKKIALLRINKLGHINCMPDLALIQKLRARSIPYQSSRR